MANKGPTTSRPTAVQRTRSSERPPGNALKRLYRGQTNFDFINRWKYWFAMSGTVILIGLVALGARGLNFSIDFRGGTVWEVPTTASVATVQADLGKISTAFGRATITKLTNRQTGKTNIQVAAPADITSNSTLVAAVTHEMATIGHVPTDDVTLTAIGPSWGSTISSKAIEAVVVFLVLISVCIAIYFETKMAVGALVALLHDMLITVGIYALSGFQVSPDTVIAFLTVLGYSLYDTIVVFDKVKENTKGLASTNRVTYTDVVNLSMNQVMARSVNTSFVAIMPVFCILVIGSWIMGASALNDFGLALFIGLMSGAYSSIFIASPILALLKEREPRYVEIRRRLAAYPQSRQVLTAATVSEGVLVGPRASASQVGRVGFAGAGAGAGERVPAGAGMSSTGIARMGLGGSAGAGSVAGPAGELGAAGPAGELGVGGFVLPALAGPARDDEGAPVGEGGAGFESYAGPVRSRTATVASSPDLVGHGGGSSIGGDGGDGPVLAGEGSAIAQGESTGTGAERSRQGATQKTRPGPPRARKKAARRR